MEKSFLSIHHPLLMVHLVAIGSLGPQKDQSHYTLSYFTQNFFKVKPCTKNQNPALTRVSTAVIRSNRIVKACPLRLLNQPTPMLDGIRIRWLEGRRISTPDIGWGAKMNQHLHWYINWWVRASLFEDIYLRNVKIGSWFSVITIEHL